MRRLAFFALTALIFSMSSAAVVADKKAETKPAVTKETKEPEMKLSDIPSITTPDRTPHACVDCHKNYPEMKKDFRIMSILSTWQAGVNPEIVEKARAAAPAGRTLTGKHPDVKALVKIIPDDCLMCHVQYSRVAPPFSKLLHAIHLVGGKENHFLTFANGTCTSCHKLDEKSGTWRIGSGEEK